MLKTHYKPSFLKKFNRLSEGLQDEVEEKIELFKKDPADSFLKSHKLKGPFKGCFSFSVNYRYRVVFEYLSKKEVVLLCVGDHDIYK